MLLRLLVPSLMLSAHRLHVLADLCLLVGVQYTEDLIAQLTRRTGNALRSGGVCLRVLVEQILNLTVLLA